MSLEEAAFGIEKVVKFRTNNDDKEISVSIPAGVDTGTRIRISGEGEPGQRGAGNGDFFYGNGHI